MFPQTAVLVLGPAGLVAVLVVAALLVLLVAGTMAERRAMDASDQSTRERHPEPAFGRAA
jgi:hypothetical protein